MCHAEYIHLISGRLILDRVCFLWLWSSFLLRISTTSYNLCSNVKHLLRDIATLYWVWKCRNCIVLYAFSNYFCDLGVLSVLEEEEDRCDSVILGETTSRSVCKTKTKENWYICSCKNAANTEGDDWVRTRNIFIYTKSSRWHGRAESRLNTSSVTRKFHSFQRSVLRGTLRSAYLCCLSLRNARVFSSVLKHIYHSFNDINDLIRAGLSRLFFIFLRYLSRVQS